MQNHSSRKATTKYVLLITSICSMGLTLFAGRANAHLFLTALFVVWVLAPFVGIMAVNRFSAGWSLKSRTLIYWSGMLVSILSAAAYLYDLIYPRTSQGAFMFVITPIVSSIVFGITLVMAFYNRKVC